ncbi:serine/threonine-protein kinase [Thermocoleostomius sinensis]|uniref:Serine/threonine protein kinase n=1 Tax=Thermocoleostomius sinensis A174 TaxID=2016057 RepID=A0A9E9CBB4_9CYAN|nr:serine/threonine-protein kinase [Thermocoleostomius sinensis]WAL60245.1 serine/threonine protein kinase [Thermocoleostomius sinensis A174]
MNKNPSQSHPWISRSVGDGDRYYLESVLGSGGMGEVFLAIDTRLGKTVALKLLRESLAIAENLNLRERFERECAICAALKSEHIVQVSDYGVTAEGYPFYVMEYLQGQTLEYRLAKEPRLSVSETCHIITQVCAGLQLAHDGIVLWDRKTGSSEQIKVVHRDLKPANIFLVPTALGELVKIIDFGIAKIRSLQTNHTNATGFFLGTCHYAAPEQFSGRRIVDERADIYSLGVILYEMLTGIDPFGFDYRRQFVANEAWFAAHTSTTPLPLRSQPHCQDLPPALEAIVLRCLAKSPDDRFPSVVALSQALQTVRSTPELVPPVNAHGLKPDSLQERPSLAAKLASHDGQVNRGETTRLSPSVWLPRVVQQWRWRLLAIAGVLLLLGGSYYVAQWRQAPITREATQFDRYRLAQTLSGNMAPVWTTALHFNGQTLVSGGEDHTIRIWDLETGDNSLLSDHEDVVRSLSLSADGQLLASGSSDATIKLWRLSTRQLLRTLTGHTAAIWSIDLSRDGQTLVSGSEDGTIRVWNVQTGAVVHTLTGHNGPVYAVTLSRDGQTFASSSADKTIKIWNLQTGVLLRTLTGHTDAVRAVAFSPNGQLLASASWDKTVKIWNLQTGSLVHTLEGHRDRVVSVAFSFNGQTLVSAGLDRTIKLWNPQTGTWQQDLTGHSDWVLSVITSASDRKIISSSKDQTIKLWR